MKGFILTASLLVAGLLSTSTAYSVNVNEDIKVKLTTPGWQNPETCLGSCPETDPEDRVILLQNKDCTKYCMCHVGRPVVNVCPPGLHFSLADQVCTWAADVSCDDGEAKIDVENLEFFNLLNNIGEESVETTTEPWRNPKTCKGRCPIRDPEDHTILLENKDCSRYCVCSNGRAIVNNCPAGLDFSLKEQTCTWPIDAKCPQS